MSQHIAKMEMELGFTLVERNGELSLTPAGEYVYDFSQGIVHWYDKMVRRGLDIAAHSVTIRLEDILPTNAIEGEIDAGLRLVRESDADAVVRVELTKPGKYNEFELVDTDTVDVAFHFNTDDPESVCSNIAQCGYECEHIGRFPCSVWMDAGHPLATKDELVIDDINGLGLSITKLAAYQCWGVPCFA